MSEQPPKDKEPSLIVDTSGIEEYRQREEQARKERAEKAERDARDREAGVKELLRAEEENTSRESFRFTRQGVLYVIFFSFLTYFCLSAFFDFFNFFEGLKIIGLEVVQLIVAVSTGFAVHRSLGKIAESRAENGALWRKSQAAMRAACAIVLLYAIVGTMRTLPGLVKPGKNWNFSFINLLLFFSASLAISIALLKQRRKILEVIRDYDYERETALSAPLGTAIESGANRDQLELIQFLIEGIVLNLGLMVFFQFAYGVNVPVGVLRALSSPGILLFYFSPMLVYVFFRKFTSGLYYH